MQSLQALMKTNMDISAWLPVLSLVIAALAVFFGPLISLRIAKRQIEASLAVAKQQIETNLAVTVRQTIAPMRQKWIENLRDRVAEYDSVAAWFYRKTYMPSSGDDFASKDDQTIRMILLRQQIELMLNPNENDHNVLIDCLERIRMAAWNKDEHEKIIPAMNDLNACCKKILKQEWNRVKKGD